MNYGGIWGDEGRGKKGEGEGTEEVRFRMRRRRREGTKEGVNGGGIVVDSIL